MEENMKKECTYVHNESLRDTAEISTTLQINYMLINKYIYEYKEST